MPSQDLTVRVRVQGMGQYASEMQKGSRATKQLSTAGEDLQKVGGRVSNIGDKLTTSVTLPIVAIGAAATKMATDFDNSFTSMQTLAGLSAGEVDGLKESVLGLAGETGRAPQELAEALYFLRSSGLEGAAALEALEVSAKASAAGLGDTQVIADAVSSAMLGYAESGLKASEATDVLIATAKAGKAEPAELAAQMGRLIPTAAELGITFGDVGGAIAALSTKGNNAEAATTQLTNVMGKLMKPSQQAMEALDGVGLSTERIRELIAERGLLGTLEILKERLGDSGFTRFFEDQQAIQGALALTGGDLQKTRDIFEQVNDSVGETDKAFATWADSMGAQNARAFADFQVALIKVGDVIAPIASDVLSFAASVIGAFGELPEPVQHFVVALAAVAAAVGPLMSVGGRLMSVWGSTLKLFDNWTSAGGQGFADAMNGVATSTSNVQSRLASVGRLVATGGIIVTGFVAIGEAAEKAFGRTPANVSKLERDLLNFGESTRASGEFAKVAGDDLGKLGDALNEVFNPSVGQRVRHVNDEIGSLGGLIAGGLNKLDEAEAVIDDIDKALAALAGRDPAVAAAVFEQIIGAMSEMGIERDQVIAGFDDYDAALANAETASRTAEGATEGGTEALADQEQQLNETVAAFNAYADQLKAAFDPAFGMVHAIRQNQEAFTALEEAQRNLTEVQKDGKSTAVDVAAAQREVEDAMLGTEESALGVHIAAATLNAALAENPALIEDVKASLTEMREQGLIPNIETLGFLGGELDEATLKAIGLGETDPVVDVSETGSGRTRDRLTQVENRARAIPTSRNTHLSTSGGAAAADTIGRMISLISQIPTSRTVSLQARAGAGWGSLFGAIGNRATGGPVGPGDVTWVGEEGPELLVMGPRGGHIYNQGQLNQYAGGSWHGASASGQAGVVHNHWNFQGAVLTSKADAERWMSEIWNRGAAKGLMHVRGKRVA